MRKAAVLLTAVLLALPALGADETKEQKRLQGCGQVLKEILNIPDNIPKSLLDKAECVIVIPSVKKGRYRSRRQLWSGCHHAPHRRTLDWAVEHPGDVAFELA